jgi:hypothetical protein
VDGNKLLAYDPKGKLTLDSRVANIVMSSSLEKCWGEESKISNVAIAEALENSHGWKGNISDLGSRYIDTYSPEGYIKTLRYAKGKNNTAIFTITCPLPAVLGGTITRCMAGTETVTEREVMDAIREKHPQWEGKYKDLGDPHFEYESDKVKIISGVRFTKNSKKTAELKIVCPEGSQRESLLEKLRSWTSVTYTVCDKFMETDASDSCDTQDYGCFPHPQLEVALARYKDAFIKKVFDANSHWDKNLNNLGTRSSTRSEKGTLGAVIWTKTPNKFTLQFNCPIPDQELEEIEVYGQRVWRKKNLTLDIENPDNILNPLKLPEQKNNSWPVSGIIPGCFGNKEDPRKLSSIRDQIIAFIKEEANGWDVKELDKWNYYADGSDPKTTLVTKFRLTKGTTEVMAEFEVECPDDELEATLKRLGIKKDEPEANPFKGKTIPPFTIEPIDGKKCLHSIDDFPDKIPEDIFDQIAIAFGKTKWTDVQDYLEVQKGDADLTVEVFLIGTNEKLTSITISICPEEKTEPSSRKRKNPYDDIELAGNAIMIDVDEDKKCLPRDIKQGSKNLPDDVALSIAGLLAAKIENSKEIGENLGFDIHKWKDGWEKVVYANVSYLTNSKASDRKFRMVDIRWKSNDKSITSVRVPLCPEELKIETDQEFDYTDRDTVPEELESLIEKKKPGIKKDNTPVVTEDPNRKGKIGKVSYVDEETRAPDVIVNLKSGKNKKTPKSEETAPTPLSQAEKDRLNRLKAAEDSAIKLSGMESAAATRGTSVWKTKEGAFNYTRLAVDAGVGAVVGTAGGLIIHSIVKKNQTASGFEKMRCSIANSTVAEWDEEFSTSKK